MGEPIDGMAIHWRFHALHPHHIQEQGGRHQIRRQARIRVFRAGAQFEEVHTKGICE